MSSGVQHKLLTYEVTPPPGVWNKIAAELDESEIDHAFPSALYAAEVTPPVGIWNKIQITLNADKEKAIQKQGRSLPLLRYAAAAIITGFIAWGGIQLLNKKSVNKDIAANKTAPATKEDIDSTSPALPDEMIATTRTPAATIDIDEARNDAALEASKKTFARLDISSGNTRLRNIAATYRFALPGSTDEYPGINAQAEACSSDNTDRYIMIMNPDGKIVRISKKLSHLVCCVSAEEEDKDCKEQMGKWRNKIVASSAGHNTGNFLDLLSLVSSLQDQ